MALLGGSTSILFFNLLKPILYRLYIHKRQFYNLHKTVALDSLHTVKLKIKPGKSEYYLIYLLAFIFLWRAVLMASGVVATEGNPIILMFTPFFSILDFGINVACSSYPCRNS
ncbi:DUF443 family protein [Pseudogracilibacillus auburnensis]|nr:DUF443 family protein [Pseudogracilibacillus auburnensis]